MNKESPHFPVLIKEVLTNLRPRDYKQYLDCTFGAGGYSRAILEAAHCKVTAIDQDPNVAKYVSGVSAMYPGRFEFIAGNFADALDLTGGAQYDGVVADLGVSSMQLDEGARGFSFMHAGRLDMRMNNGVGASAADFIANATEEEIANVIYRYGEEVQSRAIAKMIVSERAKTQITSTLQLAEIVRKSMHYRKAKIDPATKTFQALRIYVNQELTNLERFLGQVNLLLKPGARILIVSFHSLEDSIVKAFFRESSVKRVARSKYAAAPENLDKTKWLQVITKKPLTPSAQEVKENPRSRSSRLRVGEKLREAA